MEEIKEEFKQSLKAKKIINNIIIFLLLVAIALMMYILVVAKSEGGKCQQDPLVYASQKLSGQVSGDFYGYGYYTKQPDYFIEFNSINMSVKLRSLSQEYPRQNFSQLIKLFEQANE